MRNAQYNISLIVGLGNPGEEYAGTRHNVGFDAIAALLESLPGKFERKHGFDSYYWEGRFRGRKLLLQTPLTFMNCSGNATAGLARKQAIPPEETMLVYDDMDLPLGKIRLRKSGGSAGHNGAESVFESFGVNCLPRLRIGIGRKAKENHIDHVLSKFDVAEKKVLADVIKGAVEAIKLCLVRGVEDAMTRFNGVSFLPDTEKTIGLAAGN